MKGVLLMINVNIRVFAEKSSTLFGDYREHIKLIRSYGEKVVEADVNDRGDCREIYQYYSANLLFLLEAGMLRRLNAGASVCCVRRTLTEAAEEVRLPAPFKKIYRTYLKKFINSMDCVIVTDEKIRQELQEEGLSRPEYYYIPESGVFAAPVRFCIWSEIYKHFMGKISESECGYGASQTMNCVEKV